LLQTCHIHRAKPDLRKNPGAAWVGLAQGANPEGLPYGSNHGFSRPVLRCVAGHVNNLHPEYYLKSVGRFVSGAGSVVEKFVTQLMGSNWQQLVPIKGVTPTQYAPPRHAHPLAPPPPQQAAQQRQQQLQHQQQQLLQQQAVGAAAAAAQQQQAQQAQLLQQQQQSIRAAGAAAAGAASMQGVQAGTAAQLANLQGPQLQQQLQLQQQQQQQQIQLMQQQQAQLAAARQQQQQQAAAMQQFGMAAQQQQFVPGPGMPGMAAGGAMSQQMALPGGVQQLQQGLAMPVRVSQQQ
jgi:hypothetical protein